MIHQISRPPSGPGDLAPAVVFRVLPIGPISPIGPIVRAVRATRAKEAV